MLKKIKTFKEYLEVFNRLSKKIDESMNRDDMIIFDEYSKCLSELKKEYPAFELERIGE